MNLISNIKSIINGFPSKVTILSIRHLTLGAIILALGSLVSCSDDLEYKNPQNENGNTSLTICIPDIEEAAEFGATRSDEYQNTRAISEAAEGGITSLWLFAYADKTNPNGAKDKVTPLTGHSSLTITTQNGYKQYQVNNFSPGNYHIYLVANLDSYLDSNSKITTNTTETELQNLILNFSTSKTLEKGNLPMYCLDTQIKNTANGNPVNSSTGVFPLSESTSIYADMNFLCSKIRYTILFDHSSNGFSYQFSSNDVNFDLNSSEAKNLANKTNFTKPTSDPVYTNSDLFDLSKITLNRVQYPADGSLYFDIKNSTVATSPANLTTTSSTWGTNTSKRAWQGIIYIPENISGSEDTQSYLKFKSNGSEMEEYYSFKPRKYERGQMYDLVAKMKQTEFDVDIKIADWTLQQLEYYLHGRYELIVEASKIAITSGEFSTMGYYTDVDQIYFDFPTINYTNSDGENMDLPLYEAAFIGDETNDPYGHPYNLSPDFNKHFNIRVNPLIPFEVLLELKLYKEYIGGNGVKYTIEETNELDAQNLNYFHIHAGNLHKKIETDLHLDAFLNVTPEVIHIETREYYLGSKDAVNPIPIQFFSNYENIGTDVEFYLHDPSGLIRGIGCKSDSPKEDLKLEPGNGIDASNVYDNYYVIRVRSGELNLHLKNITAGHDFWKERHEYTITFSLNVRNPRTGEMLKNPDGTYYIISKEVKIIVMPFTTNYIIHFYNASEKNWKAPHVFIYQDLLLPADLSKGENNDKQEVDASIYAGKIVGYREYNEGFTMNAACQYVFSNNISFRGWFGFGGPEINNPYDIYSEYINNSAYDREGFIMLGKPSSSNNSWIWNDDYGYTNRNKNRDQRYRFDVNFNEDHQRRVDNSTAGWSMCGDCYKNYTSAHGSNKDYDYPGVMMEKDDDNPGWYRYTLTGVAQPGKTMIVFCDTHYPWNPDNQGGHAGSDWGVNWPRDENLYRYPGSDETGLTLFDFEDNEGWFVFKGENVNGKTNTNHFFYDDKAEAEAFINAK